jgi:excisionase family DNA binding protein
MAESNQEFLTPKEAAAHLRISIRWFYALLRTGKGPDHSRFGRNVIRIPTAALDEWVKNPPPGIKIPRGYY